jgi:hypothetical protein
MLERLKSFSLIFRILKRLFPESLIERSTIFFKHHRALIVKADDHPQTRRGSLGLSFTPIPALCLSIYFKKNQSSALPLRISIQVRRALSSRPFTNTQSGHELQALWIALSSALCARINEPPTEHMSRGFGTPEPHAAISSAAGDSSSRCVGI